MATTEEIDLLDELVNDLLTRQWKRTLRNRYYRGDQRLKMMGLSTQLSSRG